MTPCPANEWCRRRRHSPSLKPDHEARDDLGGPLFFPRSPSHLFRGLGREVDVRNARHAGDTDLEDVSISGPPEGFADDDLSWEW